MFSFRKLFAHKPLTFDTAVYCVEPFCRKISKPNGEHKCPHCGAFGLVSLRKMQDMAMHTIHKMRLRVHTLEEQGQSGRYTPQPESHARSQETAKRMIQAGVFGHKVSAHVTKKPALADDPRNLTAFFTSK